MPIENYGKQDIGQTRGGNWEKVSMDEALIMTWSWTSYVKLLNLPPAHFLIIAMMT